MSIAPKNSTQSLGGGSTPTAVGDNFRLVQFTPPGSGNSIQFGVNLTSAAPGSARGMILAVSDIEAAHKQLVAQGVDASEVFHCATGTGCRF